MSTLRPALAIVGIVCIILFYVYQEALFLAAAVIIFVIGLVLMGAFKRPRQATQSGSSSQRK